MMYKFIQCYETNWQRLFFLKKTGQKAAILYSVGSKVQVNSILIGYPFLFAPIINDVTI